MPREVCLCESCGQPGSLALFRSPVPLSIKQGRDCDQTYAIALCVSCGIRSGFRRYFETAQTERIARSA